MGGDKFITPGGLEEMGNKKLLVADDDEAIQICMEDISKQEGWDLVFARDGKECLELIESSDPALIVLDQRMPKMTGEEVLGKMQAENKNIPVILISAEKDLSRMKRFPVIVKVLAKPFDLDDFVFLVNDQLAKSV
jgi:two-component system response regulator (stage 0 sporulation protein F)